MLSLRMATGVIVNLSITSTRNGYVRTTVGVMLDRIMMKLQADDKFRMNQAEVTLNLDFDIKTGPLNWKVITRFDKEAQTDYLR